MSRRERRLAEGHAMTGTAKVPRNLRTAGRAAGRWSMMSWRISCQTEGVELLGLMGCSGALSIVAG
jgi:hypothetical protein